MIGLPRASGAERMDAPDADPVELEQSLGDIRAVNRWLGGTRVVLSLLGRLMHRNPREEYRVLDVATGSADIPVALAYWARRRGVRVRIVATDLHPATLAEARRRTAAEPQITVEEADALRLPYANDAFDFALLCTALHHFDEQDAVTALRELGRVARIGVVVSDLRRTRVGLLGARLLAATLWRRHPMTRHDGPLSVRRAFTPRELGAMARRAGLTRVKVLGHSAFRLAMMTERETAR
jgi:ubiquinone/menaquinone biosynthesis C-methylase UbiE